MADGRDLGERQLRELADLSGGALEVLEVEDVPGFRTITISMDTRGVGPQVKEPGSGAGIQVRDRERFEITIRDSYPFRQPVVSVPHGRWAKTPHVQWTNQLCLYAAPAIEWAPSDGMDGFIGRLATWVVRAADGDLDPDGQPLHPPVAYTTSYVGRLIVHPDIGDQAPWGRDGWDPASKETADLMAWCVLDGNRVDVVEWVDWDTVLDRVLDEDHPSTSGNKPYVVVPTLLISDELGFEYPDKAWDLVTALGAAGFDLDTVMRHLARADTANRVLRSGANDEAPGRRFKPVGVDAYTDDASIPLLTALLIGTPSRRVESGRLTHLAAWALGGTGRLYTGALAEHLRKPDNEEMVEAIGVLLRNWLQDPETETDWMRVLEDRPEVTRRRDAGTPATWLAGTQIIVLGCGALGAPVAEHCTRAGALNVMVVDNGEVTPGILARQPYENADVSSAKARRLARRLNRIHPDVTEVVGSVSDVVGDAVDPDFDWTSWDLIVDATANASVRSALEHRRLTDTNTGRRAGNHGGTGAGWWPPVVTMLIGHDATRGVVTLSTPEATGGGADAIRALALHGLAHPRDWADITDDLFPAEPRTDMFFPEPGCSEPTFVGSSIQTAALAAALIDEATTALFNHRLHRAQNDTHTTYASAVRTGQPGTLRGTSRTSWPSDLTVTDDQEGYEVRLGPFAVTEMRAEVRRGARTRGPNFETGGMLLGSIDDAARIIRIDRVTGPPPDSYLQVDYFQHGTEGTERVVGQHLTASNGATGFIGYWHSHPGGPAEPSPTDKEAMASLVTPDGGRRRTLMIILGGSSDTWTGWVSGTIPTPDVFARLVPKPAADPTGHTTSNKASHKTRPTVFSTQVRPPGPHHRGGYGLTYHRPPDLKPLPWWKTLWRTP